MKIINSQQGSEEWLQLRRSKITGTDCSIILGKSPFKNVHQLWEEKLGIKETDKSNLAMAHGTLNEPIARDILIELTGMNFESIVCIHDDQEWAMASLDGYNEDNNIICEIKCPVKVDGHNLAILGEIREFYLPQIQHCLWVTGATKCIFMSYFPTHQQPVALIEVFPDLELHKIIIEKEKAFYLQLCTMEEPKEWEFKK